MSVNCLVSVIVQLMCTYEHVMLVAAWRWYQLGLAVAQHQRRTREYW